MQVDQEHVSEDRTGEGNTQIAAYESKERDSAGTNGDELGLLVTARECGISCQSSFAMDTWGGWETYKTYWTARIVFCKTQPMPIPIMAE